MSKPNSLLSPQQTTPQRVFVGGEGFISAVHRHLQCEQYPEACKAAREILAESSDPLQVNSLMNSFQQKIAVVLPGLSEISVNNTKSVSMLLEMLVTLAACSQDEQFFGIIFSSEQETPASSLLLQHTCRVVGCSVHILDDIFQQMQKSGGSSVENDVHTAACDILDLCQVQFYCLEFKTPAVHELFSRFWSNALDFIP